MRTRKNKRKVPIKKVRRIEGSHLEFMRVYAADVLKLVNNFVDAPDDDTKDEDLGELTLLG